MAADIRDRIPVLLLKTKSAPTDTYQEYFFNPSNGAYSPTFVPVLEHKFKQETLATVRNWILDRYFVPRANDQGKAAYGALIFTSQRAVEAFTSIVEQLRRENQDQSHGLTYPLDDLLPSNVPLYVVGPATARGLRALNLRCPILGEECGNGEALSAYVLSHYNELQADNSRSGSMVPKPGLLFLVGDKRRDIIPKTLQSVALAPEQRIKVDELVVYETGEMQSFKEEFTSIWRRKEHRDLWQWVIVFSPTGCKAMLESLGLLDERTGQVQQNWRENRNVLVATIGPTTRDYLVNEFGFTPEVCAETPTPEGVGNGIRIYMEMCAQSDPNISLS